MYEILSAARSLVSLMSKATDVELNEAYQRLANDANDSQFASTHEPLSGLCVAIQAEWKRRALKTAE